MITEKRNGLEYVCSEGSREATLFKGDNKIEVVVPDTIIIKGFEYKVTGIDREAFKGYSSIQKLTIGEKVKTIGPSAFQSCYGIGIDNYGTVYGCTGLMRWNPSRELYPQSASAM